MNDESLFNSIAALLPAEHREQFYCRMAHFGKLQPNDEILVVCEAMAFNALLFRETPKLVAAERQEIARLLTDAIAAIRVTEGQSLEYHQTLLQTLNRLPDAITARVDAEAVAKKIGESIRQRFNSDGLPETANALKQAAVTLTSALKQVNAVTEDLTHPTAGMVQKVNSAVRHFEASLHNSIQRIDHQLSELRNMTNKVNIMLVAAVLLTGIIVGVFIGVIIGRLIH